MSTASFTHPGGGSPTQYIIQLAQDAVPTAGDLLFSLQRQRSRILERTARGQDVDGSPFEPYNSTRPYTYYPNGAAGKTKSDIKRNKAAVRRLLRKLGEIDSRAGAVGVELGSGGVKTRNGQGIRFASYAQFKSSLGRTNPDLRGPRQPHMLAQIAVGAGFERVIGDDQNIGLRDRSNPAIEGAVGIYGEAGGRASAHNTGESPRWKGRHQRRFIGASSSDLEDVVADITKRCIERVRSVI